MSGVIAAPVLDEKWSRFIQGGVSIVIGSCDADNTPTIVRALGCRVSKGRDKVTVIVDSTKSAPVLDSINSTRAVAIVFAQPSTHIAIQLKGTDAKTTPLVKGDLELVRRYADAFVSELLPYGYTEPVIRGIVGYDVANLAAVTFTPRQAFLQTPGPKAGEPLRGDS